MGNDTDLTGNDNENEISQSKLLQMVNKEARTDQEGGKRKKKMVKKKGTKRKEVDATENPPTAIESPPVDTSLQETLKLISAHGAARPKKKRKTKEVIKHDHDS